MSEYFVKSSELLNRMAGNGLLRKRIDKLCQANAVRLRKFITGMYGE